MIKIGQKCIWFFLISAYFIFLYTPIIVLIIFSFNKTGFPYRWTSFTTEWYYDLLSSYQILDATKTSLIISLGASSLSTILAALWIYYHNKNRFSWYTFSFYLNLFIPEIIYAVSILICMSFFSIHAGFLPLIIVYTTMGFGYTIPLLLNRYSYCQRYLIEASLDLGANIHQTFWYVVIPFLRPALLVSFLLTFIISFDDFLLAFFCAGSSVQTISMYIFAMIRNGVSPAINALSTGLLAFNIIIVMYIALYILKSKQWRE